ncbi:MAG TPA: methyltransferase domain-containing protein [Stellaceae bacterium]|nr:methyltransferase domain-containing protein [Stellaceae bacterium]
MSKIEEQILPTGNRLRDRLTSWWYGLDLDAPSVGMSVDADALAAEAAAMRKLSKEPPMSRLDLLQQVWGTGYMHPGGPDYILNLVKPFGFNPAMSVLDVTVGLGGPAKHIAEKFSVYINGMEKDQEIAEAGRAAMVKAGMSKRVLISDWDPATHVMKPRRFDGIYGQHLTLTVRDKERLFKEIKKALKERGHFTFTDFVLTEGTVAAHPDLQPWFGAEQELVMPWSVNDYIDCLTAVGLDCRITESQGEIYVADTTRAWNEYFTHIDVETHLQENLKLAETEAALANTRVAMIKRGLLDVYRFYAIVH